MIITIRYLWITINVNRQYRQPADRKEEVFSLINIPGLSG
jgi:hypothetical protein